MSRVSLAGLILMSCLGWSFAQEDNDPANEAQQKLETQFDKLDQDKDGLLDESEAREFSQRRLQQMRQHGLRDDFPVPRGEFVAAGLAEMMFKGDNENSKDDESQTRMELKNDAPSTSATSEPPKDGAGPRRRTMSNKPRLFPELPADYLARDKNGDGQIGLYEWDRSMRAEFVKLDKNGDGFLTPAELAPKGSPNTARSGGSGSSASVGMRGPVPGSPGNGGGDALEQEARGAFGSLDRGRDGAIDEEEWGRSRRTREMFENAGISVSLPIDANAFVTLYRRAREGSGNNNERR